MKNTSLCIALGVTFPWGFVNAQTSPPASIERLTVVSSQVPQALRQLTTSVTLMDQGDLDNQLHFSLAELLNTAPGVGISTSGGLGKNTTIRIRGEEGFRTRLYLDGVELSDPSAPQVGPIFDDLLNSQLTQVEILRGTQGLTYGADAGGVILVQSRQPQAGIEGQIEAALSSYNTRKLAGYVGAANEHGGLSLGATHIRTDGFNAQTSDTSGEKDGYDNLTIHAKGTWQLDDQWSANVVARSVESDNQYDGCFNSLDFSSTHNCSSDAQYTTAKMSLNYQEGDQQHSIDVNHSKVTRTFFADELFGFENQGSLRQYNYLGNSQGDRIDWVYGVQLKKESDHQQSRWQRGGFVELLGHFNDELYTSLGMRFDDNETFGQHISYRAGLAKWWSFSSGDQIKFNIALGTGFRAPSLFEQNYNDGPFAFGQAAGLQLTEETSQGTDLGITYLTESGMQFEGVLFWQKIDNEILFDPESFQGYLQYSGISRSQGLELVTQIPLSDSSQLNANYTYNDAKDSDGQPRLRRPRHLLNVGLQSVWLNESLRTSVMLSGAQDAIDIGGQPLDDYWLLGVSARYEAFDNITIQLAIDNVLDRDYQTVIGFNTPKRSFSLSFQYDFN